MKRLVGTNVFGFKSWVLCSPAKVNIEKAERKTCRFIHCKKKLSQSN